MPGLTLARAEAWPASVAPHALRQQGDLVGVFLAAHVGQRLHDGGRVGIAGPVVDVQAGVRGIDAVEQGQLAGTTGRATGRRTRARRSLLDVGPSTECGSRLSWISLAWPSLRSSSTPPKPAPRLKGSTEKLARYMR